MTGYVKIKIVGCSLFSSFLEDVFFSHLLNRNYSRLDTVFYDEDAIKEQKMRRECFARNVLQKSSGFHTSINTFVFLKQGVHMEWGVFDEMESMLLIEDAFQKGCKFLQAQSSFRLSRAALVSFAEEKMECSQSVFLLQVVSGSSRATLSIRFKF